MDKQTEGWRFTVVKNIWTDQHADTDRQKGSQPVDRQVVNVIYKDSQGLATAYSRAPGDTAAICLSFVSSYKTHSALHVICQRAAHSDRYRVREDLRHWDTQQLLERGGRGRTAWGGRGWEGWKESKKEGDVKHRASRHTRNRRSGRVVREGVFGPVGGGYVWSNLE